MKIGIIGAGRWGSTLANIFCQQHEVSQWGEPAPHWQQVSQQAGNEYLQPDLRINKTTDLEEIFVASTILMVIPAQQMRNCLRAQFKGKNLKDKNIVICIKGVEQDTGLRMSEILKTELPDQGFDIFTFVGPAQPQDVLKGIPTNMVLAGTNLEKLEDLQIELNRNPVITVQKSSDLIGCEIGAAAKNVAGITAGILDGLGWHSLKGPLMVQSVKEVGELIKALGGLKETASGLAHLGDFEATLFSEHGHNRLFGEQLVKGIVDNSGKTVEGVANAKGLKIIAESKNLDLPLMEAMEEILFQHKPVQETIKKLFRSLS